MHFEHDEVPTNVRPHCHRNLQLALIYKLNNVISILNVENTSRIFLKSWVMLSKQTDLRNQTIVLKSGKYNDFYLQLMVFC